MCGIEVSRLWVWVPLGRRKAARPRRVGTLAEAAPIHRHRRCGVGWLRVLHATRWWLPA